ncbi:hypothetical protein CRYUN_Cryun21dG0055600 [Craigia yunnanensis]
MDESICNNGNYNGTNNSLISLPRLQFWDHVWDYMQRYLAIETMKKTIIAMLGALILELKANALVFELHSSKLLPALSRDLQTLSCFSSTTKGAGAIGIVGPVAKAMIVTFEKDSLKPCL